MSNKKPDFYVYISEEGNDNKTHYSRVGAAWKNSKGIGIKLKALPLDGNLVLFPPKEQQAS